MHIHKIRENILHIEETSGTYCTLIIGSDKALLVDTGYGIGPLRKTVERLISTPYEVINTHAHPDHIVGNDQFEVVLISEEDMPYAAEFSTVKVLEDTYDNMLPKDITSKLERKQFVRHRIMNLQPIQDQHVFDLGNLHCRVIMTPGHSKGSLGVLVEEERLLLSGDNLNQYLWLFFENSTDIKTYKDTLEKMLQLPFDAFLGSHTTNEFGKDKIHGYLRNLNSLRHEQSVKVELLGGEVYQARFNDPEGFHCFFYSEEKL